MEIQGTPTAADFRRFLYFHMLRKTWWYVIPLAIFLALAILATLVAGTIYGQTRFLLQPGLPLATAAVLLVYIFVFNPKATAQKLADAMPSKGTRVNFRFDDIEIGTASDHHEAKLDWTRVIEAFETESQFLFYINPDSALLVPKRFFADDAQIAAFREQLGNLAVPLRLSPPGPVGRWT